MRETSETAKPPETRWLFGTFTGRAFGKRSQVSGPFITSAFPSSSGSRNRIRVRSRPFTETSNRADFTLPAASPGFDAVTRMVITASSQSVRTRSAFSSRSSGVRAKRAGAKRSSFATLDMRDRLHGVEPRGPPGRPPRREEQRRGHQDEPARVGQRDEVDVELGAVRSPRRRRKLDPGRIQGGPEQ